LLYEKEENLLESEEKTKIRGRPKKLTQRKIKV
jgi:hypothetical protein